MSGSFESRINHAGKTLHRYMYSNGSRAQKTVEWFLKGKH